MYNVDRFMAAPDAGVQLTTLKEITNSYARASLSMIAIG